jgi:hypothetical protein
MTRFHRSLWLAAIGLLVFLAPVAGQQPTIRVRFQVVEPSFVDAFRSTLPSLQSRAAGAMAAKLDSSFRFARFVTQGPANYELRFALDRRQRGTVGRDEVGIYVSITVPDAEEIYLVPFRTREEYTDRRGTEAAFLSRLVHTVSPQQLRVLARELLTKIPVARANTAVTWPPLAWILPFRHEDLCLATTSTFRIRTLYSNASGPVEQEVVATARQPFDPPSGIPAQHRSRRNYVLAVADESRQEYRELLAAISARRRVEVREVFVQDYVLQRSRCASPISPRAAFGNPGGGE